MPHEIAFGEIYGPPLLALIPIAYILMIIFTKISTKLGWYKWIALPAIFELSLVAIFTIALSQMMAIT
ncbi:DUF1656 domain-containing protein [Shewanella subflava]|mgnify:CR=1 FL=1|uniref:DUF1656 domain-containing protein n=1 Tax=Shewanella subflava TaxID=2986476 RepID=A0ABT3IBI7_9GAMM|nr:DUF1656 domain-containing protein [Shewanella subflava]MCW3173330.1 DUF1656 domain-containing protein [Shewanella subflava]